MTVTRGTLNPVRQTAVGGGGGGGGPPETFATIAALLAQHAAAPIADGAVWAVSSVDAGDPVYGTVGGGALVPDPVRAWLDRGERSLPLARRIRRPVSLDVEPSGVDWL